MVRALKNGNWRRRVAPPPPFSGQTDIRRVGNPPTSPRRSLRGPSFVTGLLVWKGADVRPTQVTRSSYCLYNLWRHPGTGPCTTKARFANGEVMLLAIELIIMKIKIRMFLLFFRITRSSYRTIGQPRFRRAAICATSRYKILPVKSCQV